MARQNNNIIMGIIFVVFGGLLFLKNMGVDIIHETRYFGRLLWPLILLLIGILMHLSFFSNRNRDAGILVPAGILTTFGLMFLANAIIRWVFHINLMAYLWPVFPLGVAIGLFESYVFGNRDKGLLFPVILLGGFSIIALVFNLAGSIIMGMKHFFLPAILIFLGASILLKNR